MLTLDQRIALSDEIDATSTLFRHGFALLRGYEFASRDAEAVFVCLAGGVEKLLKLSIGLVALDDQRAWPAQATMRLAGHRISELDASVRESIARRTDRSTAPGSVADLLEVANANPGISQILQTMERYAVNGRFYNLDRLGGRDQPEDSPRTLWEELHEMVIEANPELLEQLAGDERPVARRTINTIVAHALGQWCELLQQAWSSGAFGGEAQLWSSQLDLGHFAE